MLLHDGFLWYACVRFHAFAGYIGQLRYFSIDDKTGLGSWCPSNESLLVIEAHYFKPRLAESKTRRSATVKL